MGGGEDKKEPILAAVCKGRGRFRVALGRHEASAGSTGATVSPPRGAAAAAAPPRPHA